MIAIGLSLCYLANVWNIGAEGQFLIGAVAGSWLAVKNQRHRRGTLGLARMLLLGAAAGALYALIPAICRDTVRSQRDLDQSDAGLCRRSVLDYLGARSMARSGGYNFPTTAEFDPVATVRFWSKAADLHLGGDHRARGRGCRGGAARRTIRALKSRVVGAAPRAARFGGFIPIIDSSSPSPSPALWPDLRDHRGCWTCRHLQPELFTWLRFHTAIIVAFLGRLNQLEY